MDIRLKSINLPTTQENGNLEGTVNIFGTLDLTQVQGYRYNTKIQVEKLLLEPKTIP